MSSLTDLNTFGNTTLNFTDNRLPGVKFTWPVARDIDTLIKELYLFRAQTRIDIEEVVRPSLANVSYSIDVSSVSGTTVSWPVIPSGCSVSSGNGIFTISGIDSAEIWQQVKDPYISVPSTYNGSFFYNSSINYFDNTGLQTKQWQVGIFIPVSNFNLNSTISTTAINLRGTPINLNSFVDLSAELSFAGFSSPTDFDWLVSTSYTLTTPDAISENDNGTDNYEIIITPSTTTTVDTLSSSGTGGNSTFDALNKTLTITGTLSEVNSHLDNVTFVSDTTKVDFNLVYTSENTTSGNGVVFNVTQFMNCLHLDYLTDPRGDATYISNVKSLIGPESPIIYDPDYTGSGDYTLTITPTVPNQIENIDSTGLIRWGFDVEITDIVYGVNNVDPQDAEIAWYNIDESQNIQTDQFIAFGHETSDTKGIIQIYKRNNEYELERVQTINGTYSGQRLGLEVIMSDVNLIVSQAHISPTLNNRQGKVLVYEKNTGADTWSVVQTITEPTTSADAYFGRTMQVTRDGSKLVILNDDNELFIYEKNVSGTYVLEHTETGLTNAYSDIEISQDGNRIAVGGELLILEYNGSSWSTAYFEDINPGSISSLGFANSGDTLFASNPNADTDTLDNCGSVYIYTRNGAGTWSLQTQIDGTADYQRFGSYLRTNKDGDKVSYFTDLSSESGSSFTSSIESIYKIYDYNISNHTLTEDRTIDYDTKLKNEKDRLYSINVNEDFTEFLAVGKFPDNSVKPFTYSYGPKNNFDTNTKIYTYVGNKTEINNDIDNITITSAVGENDDIELTFDLLTPLAITDSKIMNVERD